MHEIGNIRERMESILPIDAYWLHWAINNFCTFKSSGLDDINPAALQRKIDVVTPWHTGYIGS